VPAQDQVPVPERFPTNPGLALVETIKRPAEFPERPQQQAIHIRKYEGTGMRRTTIDVANHSVSNSPIHVVRRASGHSGANFHPKLAHVLSSVSNGHYRAASLPRSPNRARSRRQGAQREKA
jgi:hypothetical protein